MAEGWDDSGGRYRCSPSAERRRGRRRLAALLVAASLAALAAALFAWQTARTVPAVLAAFVAIVPLFAWRVSGDLDPLELWLGSRTLTIRTRRYMMEVALAGAEARRLEPREIEHLRRLASLGAGYVTSGRTLDSHLLGELGVCASDLANGVLLELGEERLVVTPDNPDDFLEALAVAGVRPAVG